MGWNDSNKHDHTQDPIQTDALHNGPILIIQAMKIYKNVAPIHHLQRHAPCCQDEEELTGDDDIKR